MLGFIVWYRLMWYIIYFANTFDTGTILRLLYWQWIDSDKFGCIRPNFPEYVNTLESHDIPTTSATKANAYTVSNHWQLDSLFSSLFRPTPKKLQSSALLYDAGFPSQRVNLAEKFSMSWRYYDTRLSCPPPFQLLAEDRSLAYCAWHVVQPQFNQLLIADTAW